MNDFQYLLEQYRSLWNNRSLSVQVSHERTLVDAITRELKDESTHPRLRRTMLEKFYIAIERITRSSLSHEDKLSLIDLHVDVMKRMEK